MKQGYQLVRIDFGGNHAVHVGLNLPRIAFIAVQHAVRNAGTIERFEYAQKDPARAALPNILPEFRRRNCLMSIWRGSHGYGSRSCRCKFFETRPAGAPVNKTQQVLTSCRSLVTRSSVRSLANTRSMQ